MGASAGLTRISRGVPWAGLCTGVCVPGTKRAQVPPQRGGGLGGGAWDDGWVIGTMRADQRPLEVESRRRWLGIKSNCVHSGVTNCSAEASATGPRDGDTAAEAEGPCCQGCLLSCRCKWTKRMSPKGQGVMRNHLVGERSYFRWAVREAKIQAEGRSAKALRQE